MFYDYMIYIVFDFMMAVIMFLFGMWFYKSEGKAANFLSGYNMKSADERKKYDENAIKPMLRRRKIVSCSSFIFDSSLSRTITLPEVGVSSPPIM